ncbi:MAG: hypothetical protein GX783_07855 [Clostridiales bacterium]|nr:hypothetical protein [Clostridiales bacterium]
MSFDNVKAESFYQDNGDKIKLNWLLYEYANLLYMEITKSRKLTNYRKRHSEDKIIAFCVYYAKRLKKSIHDMQTGSTASVVFNGKYVYEFHPNNSYAQTQLILRSALAAWEEQLRSCVGCPHRCLEDGYEITAMFDSLEKFV